MIWLWVVLSNIVLRFFCYYYCYYYYILYRWSFVRFYQHYHLYQCMMGMGQEIIHLKKTVRLYEVSFQLIVLEIYLFFIYFHVKVLLLHCVVCSIFILLFLIPLDWHWDSSHAKYIPCSVGRGYPGDSLWRLLESKIKRRLDCMFILCLICFTF